MKRKISIRIKFPIVILPIHRKDTWKKIMIMSMQLQLHSVRKQ